MEDIRNKIKAVIGDKNVQIIDSETGKELTLDELVIKLSDNNDDIDSERINTALSFLKIAAREVRVCLEKLPNTRETSLAITKLDECMLWVKSFEMNNKKD
jgi:hypothetical protein